MGRGLLPRLDAHGLREHVNRDGFLSALQFPIATKTEQVFQAILSCGRATAW